MINLYSLSISLLSLLFITIINDQRQVIDYDGRETNMKNSAISQECRYDLDTK